MTGRKKSAFFFARFDTAKHQIRKFSQPKAVPFFDVTEGETVGLFIVVDGPFPSAKNAVLFLLWFYRKPGWIDGFFRGFDRGKNRKTANIDYTSQCTRCKFK
jgi:hypothetical protein